MCGELLMARLGVRLQHDFIRTSSSLSSSSSKSSSLPWSSPLLSSLSSAIVSLSTWQWQPLSCYFCVPEKTLFRPQVPLLTKNHTILKELRPWGSCIEIYIHRLLNSISNPKREHNLIFWLNDIFLNKGARPKVRMRDDWEWCVVPSTPAPPPTAP